MYLIKKFEKNKFFYFFLFLIYICSLIYIKETIFIFYNSTDSPDFIRYFKYLEFNFNISAKTYSEQGFLYYDLQSFYLYFRNFNLTEQNFFIYLSKSIQELNTLLFLIGSLGLFKLFKFYQYSNFQIITSLLVVNFTPIALAQRIVFKPEIMIFSLLPWLILSLELFLKSKKLIFLVCSFPLLNAILLQKGSSLVMVSVFILIFYFKNIIFILVKINKIRIFLLFLSFSLPLYFTYLENTKLNNQNILELQSGSNSESKYNNKGDLSLIYRLNPEKLFFYPYKNEHSNSAIAITLLDSFGDYFEIYWNNDSSNFSKNRNNIFNFEKNLNTKAPNFDFEKNQITIFTQENENFYYLRQVLSICLAIFFYVNFFLLFKKVDKNKKKIFFLPFLGYLVLIIHIVTGFPENNFDPLIGDTLKPFYYSFLLVITIGFVITEINKTKRGSILILIFFIPCFMYIYGFPKIYSENSKNLLSQVNSYTTFCFINNKVFGFLSETDMNCDKKPESIQIYNYYEKFSSFKFSPNLHILNFINFICVTLSILKLNFVRLKI